MRSARRWHSPAGSRSRWAATNESLDFVTIEMQEAGLVPFGACPLHAVKGLTLGSAKQVLSGQSLSDGTSPRNPGIMSTQSRFTSDAWSIT